MKFLLSAINGSGVGHIVRMVAVARALRVKMPEAEILFITSSEAAGITWREGFPSVKIPSWASMERGMIAQSDYNYLNTSVVAATISSFRPDVLIADTFPLGEGAQLLSAISLVQKRALILDIFPHLISDKNYQSHVSNSNLFLLPFHKDSVKLPFSLSAPSAWIGPVIYRTRADALTRAEARKFLGIPDDVTCFYLALGGGGNPEFQSVMDWIGDAMGNFPNIQFVEAVPPLASPNAASPRADNIRPVSLFPIADYFNAFDGAISSAGMNTIAELTHFGLPTIWVPLGQNVSSDQEWRAQRHADAGLGWKVARLDSEALTAAMKNLTSPVAREQVRQKMLAQPAPNGAQNCAEIIANWLGLGG